jgi:hypothetical protein
LPEGIEKEIRGLAPATIKIKVVTPPQRKVSGVDWSINLDFTATFPQMVITHKK